VANFQYCLAEPYGFALVYSSMWVWSRRYEPQQGKVKSPVSAEELGDLLAAIMQDDPDPHARFVDTVPVLSAEPVTDVALTQDQAVRRDNHAGGVGLNGLW
jgi:hypothetical protein